MNSEVGTGEFEFRLAQEKELVDYILTTNREYKPGIDMFRPPFQFPRIAATCSHNGKLTGICEVRSGYNTIRIFVERSSRGMGIGKNLLSMVCEEAKRQNAHFLIAIMNPENLRSASLYSGAGFQTVGTIYLEKWPYDGLGIGTRPGTRVVKVLALSVYGIALAKMGRLALRLIVLTPPISRLLNFVAIMTLQHSDSKIRLRVGALAIRRILSQRY